MHEKIFLGADLLRVYIIHAFARFNAANLRVGNGLQADAARRQRCPRGRQQTQQLLLRRKHTCAQAGVVFATTTDETQFGCVGIMTGRVMTQPGGSRTGRGSRGAAGARAAGLSTPILSLSPSFPRYFHPPAPISEMISLGKIRIACEREGEMDGGIKG